MTQSIPPEIIPSSANNQQKFFSQNHRARYDLRSSYLTLFKSTFLIDLSNRQQPQKLRLQAVFHFRIV